MAEQQKTYTRRFTQEQTDRAAELLSQNISTSVIANELGLTWGRAKTLLTKLEVMEAAHKLRMTDLVPEQLAQLATTLAAALALLSTIESRQSSLEAAMRKMNRTVRNKVVTIQRQKDTIQLLRKQERDLRTLIRKRGFV